MENNYNYVPGATGQPPTHTPMPTGNIHIGHPLPDGTYFECGGEIDYAGNCTKCGKAVY